MIEEMHRLWSGDEWQEFVNGLLAIRHRNDGFQPVPDSGGDGGIEAWSGNGIAYQCYAAEGRPGTRELCQKQKNKISTDIKKFHENGAVLSGIIGRAITTWILVVPRTANKDVVRFALEKQAELRTEIAAKKLSYASPNIEIYVHDLEAFQHELGLFQRPHPLPAAYATPWGQSVADSPLWKRVATTTQPTEPLRDAAAALANECWYATSDDERRKRNRWIDAKAPERAVQALSDLTDVARLSPALDAVEVALALTAPFLRDCAIASAESLAFDDCHPYHPAPDAEAGTPIRRALRVRWQKQPHITRRVAALRNRGNPEAAEDTAHWLLRRAVIATPTLWKRRSMGGFLADETADRIAGILQSAAAPLGKLPVLTENPFAFARFVGADEERLQGAWRGTSLPSTQRIPPALGGGVKDVMRPRLLAALLALAGKQALEPLELGSILVDQIGLTDPLKPAEIVAHAGRTDSAWEADGAGRLTLKAECRHPAIGAAFGDQVKASDALRRWLDSRRTDWLPAGSDATLPEYGDGVVAAPDPDKADAPLYEKQQIRFTMDADQVKELLMGAQLYGDPELAIRELYQNALDACRYRGAREDYLERSRPGYHRAWTGRIEFEQGIDAQGRPYIECRDNGVGMDEHILMSCFARAGKRFTDTDEYLEERSEWDSLDGEKIELWPNSRFGIGVFSYFMLADEIRITTRRFTRTGNSGDTLTVSIAGSGSLFHIRRNVEARDAGSTIRLYLSQTTVKVEGERKTVSCTDFLNDNLLLAQYPVVATFGDERHQWPGDWQPRELYDGGALVRSEEKTVYWWIPSGNISGRKVEGVVILNDGIRIGRGLLHDVSLDRKPRPVCNLFGPNAPIVGVDRQSIQEFDEFLVNSRINRTLYAGANSDWLSFYTLSSLSSLYPKVAENTVLQLLSQGRFRVPVSGFRTLPQEDGDENLNEIDLSEFGVCGADSAVFDKADDLSSARFEEEKAEIIDDLKSIYPVPEMKDRIGIISDADESIFEGHDISRIIPDSPFSPQPASPMNISLLSRDLNGKSPWIEGFIPHGHILNAIRKFSEPASSIVSRLRQLTPLGAILPNLDEELLDLLKTDDRYCILLSLGLDGRWPWIEDAIPLGHILKSAHRSDEPISDIVSRLRRLLPLGIALPDIDDGQLSSLTIDERDLALLSRDFNGRWPWIEDRVPLRNILRAATEFNEPVSAIVARLRRLAPLGIALPDIDDGQLSSLTIDNRDRKLLTRDFDGRAPWLENNIPPGHILKASSKLNEPVSDIVSRLRQLAPLGIALPDIDDGQLSSLTIDDRDLALLSRDFNGRWPWIEGCVPLRNILRGATEFNEPVSAIVSRLRRLAPLGIALPDIDNGQLSSLIIDDHDRKLLSRDFDGHAPWLKNNIPPSHILRASSALNEPVSAIVFRLRRLAPLGIALPDIDDGQLSSLTIDDGDLTLISYHLDGRWPWLEQNVPLDHILNAADAFDEPVSAIIARLRRLAPLGVTLPPDDKLAAL